MDEKTVFYIGGVAGGKPYHPATRECKDCKFVQQTQYRANLPGLIP